MTDRHDDILDDLWRLLDISSIADINVLFLLAGEREVRAEYRGPRLVVDNTTTVEGTFPTDTPFEPEDPNAA